MPLYSIALNAHDGPQGVFGTYNSKSDNPNLSFDGRVTCLFVQGNQATVGGVVRKGGNGETAFRRVPGQWVPRQRRSRPDNAHGHLATSRSTGHRPVGPRGSVRECAQTLGAYQHDQP